MCLLYNVINITRQRYIPIINAQISISRIFNKTSAMSHLAERIEASNKKKEKKERRIANLDFHQLLSSLKINKSRFYGNQREFASRRNGSAEMRVSLPIKSSLEIN